MIVPLAALAALPLASVPQHAERPSIEGRLEPRTEVWDAPRPVSRAAATAAPSAAFLPVDQPPEADMPRDLAFTPDGARVVVVNRDTDNVTVYDVATRAPVATIGVGDFPVDVEVSPDGAVAVVPNVLDDTVSVIDLAALAVRATVPVTGTSGQGAQPYGVRIDPTSSFALVGAIDGAVVSRFSVIDLGTDTETASFTTTPHGVFGGFGTPEPGIFGNLFTDWELTPDGARVLVPDRGGDALSIHDVATGALVVSLPVGDAPTEVDVSADGTTAVVSLDGTGASVTVVDLVATPPAIAASHVTGSSTFAPAIRITPDKSHAILGVSNNVEFVDLATGAVSSTVSTGSVGDIELSFDGQYAIVSNFNTRVIDIAAQSTVATLTLAACADAAASPTAHVFVALNNRFREDVHFYATDGGSSAVLGKVIAGVPPEADAPRALARTPDGRTVLVNTNTSDTVLELDVETATITNVYAVGERGFDVDVAATGDVAVACNTESHTISVLDLASGTVVADVSVPQRPVEVEISPDGTRAYVTTVQGTDRLYFVDLAGAASAVTSSLITGQMGSILYTYNVASGLSLSPDGATLAVCISFDDELLLVDTATASEIARVPVGDFPIRAAWAPDGSAVYVTHSFGDSLSRVAFSGAGSGVTGTAANIEFPLDVELSADGAHAAVASFDFSSPRVAIVDTQTMTEVDSLPLPQQARPRRLERVGTALFVARTDGVLGRARFDGASSSFVESVPIAGSPADLVVCGELGVAVLTEPGAPDGLDLVTFGGDATSYCGPAVPNSSGGPATIRAEGTFLAGGLPLRLVAEGLPQNSFGYFLNSLTQDSMPGAGGSQGTLCLGGTVGRFNLQVQNSGPAGAIAIDVDTTAMPQLPTAVAIQPGETWNFQSWFRDANPTVTSNFTDGLSILFE